jgi:hypothetical protein
MSREGSHRANAPSTRSARRRRAARGRSWSLFPFTILTLACAPVGSTRDAVHQGADCLGPDSLVVITADKIGRLPLDLSLAALQRRCGTMQWTTTNGDESLDTAIVMTEPGIVVVGAVATVANEDGYHPVRIDSSSHVQLWKISGTAAVLPKGVRIDATWRDLSRAYGPMRAFALNGIVYVTICAMPEIGILMDTPDAAAPINDAPPLTVDSVMAMSRIRTVTLRAQRQPASTPAC